MIQQYKVQHCIPNISPVPVLSPPTIDVDIRIECDTVCGVGSSRSSRTLGRRRRDTWAVFYPDTDTDSTVSGALMFV